jgi:tRNA(Arg) A34 adenosine deaminase TadA
MLVGPKGEVLAEDHNPVLSEADISAHSELKLASWAARELDPETALATTMYTSCQPCSMCSGAIQRSGPGRVVFALSSQQVADLKSNWLRTPRYSTTGMAGWRESGAIGAVPEL